MADPLISVIIPTLNMGQYLGFALASIWRQNHPSIEALVIDTGSTDGTEAVVADHARAGHPVRLVRAGPAHPSKARNIGISESASAFVAFLDADDLWPAGKLERQLGRLTAEPSLRMVTGYVTYFEEASDDGLSPRPGSRTQSLFHVNVGASVYRRDAFGVLGRAFDEDFIYSEDIDLLLRVREAGMPFWILRTPELYYRQHPGSMMAADNPLKAASFSIAMRKSLVRRRAAGTLGKPIPDFSAYLEPV